MNITPCLLAYGRNNNFTYVSTKNNNDSFYNLSSYGFNLSTIPWLTVISKITYDKLQFPPAIYHGFKKCFYLFSLSIYITLHLVLTVLRQKENCLNYIISII